MESKSAKIVSFDSELGFADSSLVQCMVEAIHSLLREKEICETEHYDLVGDIVFTVASIIDDAQIDSPRGELKPVISYLDQSSPAVARYFLSSTDSSLHELVYAEVERHFGELSD